MTAFKIENETIADGFYACPAVYEDAESITRLLVRTAEWLRDRVLTNGADFSKGKIYMISRGQLKRDMCLCLKR